MSDMPAWKKAMQEPNAIGWVAFAILVVAIGVGTVFFGSSPAGKDSKLKGAMPKDVAPITASHEAK